MPRRTASCPVCRKPAAYQGVSKFGSLRYRCEPCRKSFTPPLPLTEQQQAMVEANIRLVWRIATKVEKMAWARGAGIDKDELFCMGVQGLIRAVQKLDTSLAQLSTYANIWIYQAIYRQAECYYAIKIPKQVRKKMRDREPEDEKTAAASLVQREWQRPDALDNGWSEYETKPSGDTPERREIQSRVAELIQTLPHREQTIIRQRFGIGCQQATLSRVGNRLGISKERARQIERLALRSLRRTVGNDREDYFD